MYDSAHMGHARNYLTVDIIRRVLEDYFGYNVLFIMNVTGASKTAWLQSRGCHTFCVLLPLQIH